MGRESSGSSRSQAAPADGLSRRAGFLVAQLGTHRHRRFVERLAVLDLHPRHFGMLSQIAENEGQSQQHLSRALGLHRSAVVALIDELEGRGLAERRRDPADRRAYELYLTTNGRRVLTKANRLADEAEDEFLAALNPSERRALIALLQRVAASEGLKAGVHPDLDSQGDSDSSRSGV